MTAAAARTAFITGAGRGIGAAAAHRLARGGWRVVLLARSAAEIQNVAAGISQHGGAALELPGDVSDEQAVNAAVRAAVERFGGIDLLVNAAGTVHLGPVAEMSLQAFERVMAVNARGVFLTCRAVWPVMAARGGGVIVNVTSMAAGDPFTGLAAYGGSKAFVETLTRGLADEGRKLGIRAFAVAPGAVATRMLSETFPQFPRDEALSPDEVAGMIEWFCDARCSAASGQTLRIERRK